MGSNPSQNFSYDVLLSSEGGAPSEDDDGLNGYQCDKSASCSSVLVLWFWASMLETIRLLPSGFF